MLRSLKVHVTDDTRYKIYVDTELVFGSVKSNPAPMVLRRGRYYPFSRPGLELRFSSRSYAYPAGRNLPLSFPRLPVGSLGIVIAAAAAAVAATLGAEGRGRRELGQQHVVGQVTDPNTLLKCISGNVTSSISMSTLAVVPIADGCGCLPNYTRLKLLLATRRPGTCRLYSSPRRIVKEMASVTCTIRRAVLAIFMGRCGVTAGPRPG
jgi:hypothetical protein